MDHRLTVYHSYIFFTQFIRITTHSDRCRVQVHHPLVSLIRSRVSGPFSSSPNYFVLGKRIACTRFISHLREVLFIKIILMTYNSLFRPFTGLISETIAQTARHLYLLIIANSFN